MIEQTDAHEIESVCLPEPHRPTKRITVASPTFQISFFELYFELDVHVALP